MLVLTDAMRVFTGFSALTVIALGSGAILCATNRSIGKRERRVFLVSIISLMLITAFDWFGYVTSGSHPELRWLHTVLMAVTFAIAPFIPVSIAHVIFPDSHDRLAMIVLTIHTGFQLISIFGGFVFWVDENNVYHRGPFYIVYMAVYTASSVYLVVESIRAGRTYQQVSFVAVISILICLAFGVLIQVFNADVRTTWPAVAVAVMLYFMFYADMILRSDALTKLLNRHSFEEFLARPTLPCVFVMVDVDDFKHANDTYGHAFGDACLANIAGMLRRIFGGAGLCYRTGGDEFVVIMTDRHGEVDGYIEKVKAAVEEARSSDERLPGVSVGYAFADKDCESVVSVLNEADQAMYKSKRLGKRESR